MRYHQSPSPSPESPQCRPRRSLRPSAPDRHPPTARQFPSLPSAAHLLRSHVSQAFNSYVYRENLKKRIKAGSPKALRAQRKELEREEKKANKRKAARELAARARPQPRPSKQKKCTADGRRRAVRDGQCEIVPGQCTRACENRVFRIDSAVLGIWGSGRIYFRRTVQRAEGWFLTPLDYPR